MMKKFGMMVVLAGLVFAPSFAMEIEAFESGDLARMKAICTKKIQEFDGTNEAAAQKFDALLLMCLDDDTFLGSLSDGSYTEVFAAIKPYLQDSQKPDPKRGASGGQKTSLSAIEARRMAHAQWLALKTSGDEEYALACQMDMLQPSALDLTLSDEALAQALQAELNQQDKQDKRTAPGKDSDAMLAQALQREFDEERREAASAQLRRAAPLGKLEQIRENPRLDDMKRQIVPIFAHLESLPNMMDVHVLDGYVQANLDSVVTVGRTLKAGDPNLPFETIQADMKSYFQNDLIKLELNGEVVPQPTFLRYVDAVFQADFKGQGEVFRELVSRTWSFAREVHSTGQEGERFLTELASGIVENYATGGGCLAGRMNRVFAAYVRMLHYAMDDSK